MRSAIDIAHALQDGETIGQQQRGVKAIFAVHRGIHGHRARDRCWAQHDVKQRDADGCGAAQREHDLKKLSRLPMDHGHEVADVFRPYCAGRPMPGLERFRQLPALGYDVRAPQAFNDASTATRDHGVGA